MTEARILRPRAVEVRTRKRLLVMVTLIWTWMVSRSHTPTAVFQSKPTLLWPIDSYTRMTLQAASILCLDFAREERSFDECLMDGRTNNADNTE